MSEIISFTDKAKEIELLVWQCQCGNCSFMLYENGAVQCSECDLIQDGAPKSAVVAKWTRKVRE